MTPMLVGLALAVVSPARTDKDPYLSLAPGFASSVVMVGDEILVGRARATTSPPVTIGAIHVFRRAGDAWSEAGTFAARDTRLGDGFGAALVTDGGLLAVGAPRAAEGAGAVYFFSRRDGIWTEIARVTRPEGAEGDLFGATLALRGGLLVVGAPGRDSARGAAYAFRRAGDEWVPAGEIGRGVEPGDRFGAALAIAGDRALIGAPGPLGGPGPQGRGPRVRAGAAIMYRASGGQWSEEARLVPGTDSVRAFGQAVALEGDAAYVSAPLSSGNSGLVYEFRRRGNGWDLTTRIAPVAPPSGARLGMALAAGGGSVFVTAMGTPQQPGGVYVFERQGDAWSERQQLSSGAPFGDFFGGVLRLAANQLLVAAPGADFGEGKVYAFRRDGSGAWTEVAALIDTPKSLPAVTGGEVRCGETGEAAGFKCQDVDLLSFLPVTALGGKRGVRLNDIWGWTDPETNREYALVGRMDGTAFVDVTDPAHPVYLGELPMHQGARANTWRDIKVYKDHAFIVADGAGPHGMQVFDLTQLRNVANPPVTFQETAHYDRIASAHNIAINEATGFAYPIGNSGGGETCGGALHMIDIRDPRNPTFAGCFADRATGYARTGYTHDAQCVTYQGPDTRFAGREICFNSSENALGIADVTDKQNPKPIASAAYPNVSYAHQGWLSDDQRYFYLDDEGDELSGHAATTRTLVWDLTKLDEPVLAKEFMGTTPASDHNLYVRGRYVFQSNYVAGLRVLDIADPVNPVEVAYFDTVIGDNVAGFDGSWSNYPYFKSGTIVVTSVREGLFVVRHRPRQPVP